MSKQVIYLDYAATTPVDAEVIAAALPYYGSTFFNPASAHTLGQVAASAVEFARRACEKAINADRGTVHFTASATEAINQVLKGIEIPQDGNIVISGIEHDAVKSCAERLELDGKRVLTVMPDKNGMITPKALEKELKYGKTALVCVMTVNNIVGSIQPIKDLAAVAHKNGALFFTDAVQAVNTTELNVKDTDVDMLCVSGHKFYSLKGCGMLYVKNGVKIKPLLDGGNQEHGNRAGTVDVPAVMAFAEALTKAQNNVDSYNAHAKELKAAFLNELKHGVYVKTTEQVDDIVSIAFDGVDGGRLAVALSMAGVCCSVGSACSAGSATQPDAIVNMGRKDLGESVRFSFGKPTTVEQAIEAAKIVNETVEKLVGGGV